MSRKPAGLAAHLAAILALLILSGCACAITDEDSAEGKPPFWQCLVAGAARATACKTQTTDPSHCSP